MKLPIKSSIITRDVSLGAAHAMLKATVKSRSDIYKHHIGIGTMWYEGNPCNMHLQKLSSDVSTSITLSQLLSRQFNTIGVSDGISMGTEGMRYSLPSREIIADSIECHVSAMHYDSLITIPSCDKNIPGALMGMLRLNLPGFIIYGGSIMPGCHKGNNIDVVTAFQSFGEMKSGKITENERYEIINNACPGAGSCGGMYTANTMATICEAIGMTLPNSSSNMAMSTQKISECSNAGNVISKLIALNLKPKDIVTKESIKNGLVMAMALGGSTNMVLHILAIANEANINLSYNDIQTISNNTPLIADLKPSGKYVMSDIFFNGGMTSIMKYLLNCGLLNGDCITITGSTLKENLDSYKEFDLTKQIIYPITNPIKNRSHIQILYGNIAPDGAVAKITGKEGEKFIGKALVFDSEDELMNSLEIIKTKSMNEYIVIVIRYQGPSVGMPEMLKATSALAGINILDKVALITDGRFSGGSHGFIIGHIAPEAYKNGPIAHINNDDIISIDAIDNTINVEKKSDKQNQIQILKNTGFLKKFSDHVSSASKGCITNYYPIS